MEVATWPGVRRRWGRSPGRGAGWEKEGRRGPRRRRREGGPAGAQAQAPAEGTRSAFFYLLWCDSRHPPLIGPARHVGPSGEGETAHFSFFPRRLWPFRVLCESQLISGLGKTRSDLFIFGNSRGRGPRSPQGCGWETAELP